MQLGMVITCVRHNFIDFSLVFSHCYCFDVVCSCAVRMKHSVLRNTYSPVFWSHFCLVNIIDCSTSVFQKVPVYCAQHFNGVTPIL